MRLRSAATFALAGSLLSGLLLVGSAPALALDIYSFSVAPLPAGPGRAHIQATLTNELDGPLVLHELSARLTVGPGLAIDGPDQVFLDTLGDGQSWEFGWDVTGCGIDSFFDVFVDFTEIPGGGEHRFGPFPLNIPCEPPPPPCPPDCTLDPPPDEVSVESDFTLPDGTPVIFRDQDTTFSKDVTAHCGAGSPVQVKLVLTPQFPPADEVMLTYAGGEMWSAAFTPSGHGFTTLTFYVDCPPDTPGFPEDTGLISSEDEIQDGGAIFIDPSGTVVDACTGAPLAGATVTLLKEISLGVFAVPSPSEHIPPMNPQVTGPTGAYGWLVVPGTWKLHVEKPGYGPTDSASLTIPPAVTDLTIELTPTAGCALDVDASLQALEDDIDATTALKKHLRHELTKKIDEVQKELAKRDPKEKHYCNKLDGFLKKLEQKTGKDGLTAAQATEWRDRANAIRSALGCP